MAQALRRRECGDMIRQNTKRISHSESIWEDLS
jgi:hypothetical protein